jgi:hypothetical protein
VAASQGAIEYHFDLQGVAKGFRKVMDSSKRKTAEDKRRVERVKELRDEKVAKARGANEILKGDLAEKATYLRQKDRQRGKLITEIKEALKEDIDQKKEISLLKKKDQMENYERGKNFH